jgi:uncharacterized protein YciI
MKSFSFILAFFLITFTALAQTKYDEQRAKKAGADDYGMKPYVMVILKKGPLTVTDSVERSKLMMGHLKNIMRLAEEGKLAVAGPFIKDKDFSGLFIFNVATIEEARKLAETDPAVKAGVFVLEYHNWYATAALTEIMENHKAMQKKGITD